MSNTHGFVKDHIEERKLVGIAESLSKNYSTVTSYIWPIMLIRHPEITESSLKEICNNVSISLLTSLRGSKLSSNVKAQLAINAGVITLPQSYQNVLLLPILQHCNKLKEEGGDLLAVLALMLRVLETKDVPKKIWNKLLTIEAVFNVWCYVSSTRDIQECKQVYAPLQHCLENIMTDVLLKSENYGRASVHLFQKICEYGAEAIATLALKAMHDRKATESFGESLFLCALIKYDISIFGTMTLKMISDDMRESLTFDMVTATLVREVLRKRLKSISGTILFVDLTVWLNRRIFEHMRSIVSNICYFIEDCHTLIHTLPLPRLVIRLYLKYYLKICSRLCKLYYKRDSSQEKIRMNFFWRQSPFSKV